MYYAPTLFPVWQHNSIEDKVPALGELRVQWGSDNNPVWSARTLSDGSYDGRGGKCGWRDRPRPGRILNATLRGSDFILKEEIGSHYRDFTRQRHNQTSSYRLAFLRASLLRKVIRKADRLREGRSVRACCSVSVYSGRGVTVSAGNSQGNYFFQLTFWSSHTQSQHAGWCPHRHKTSPFSSLLQQSKWNSDVAKPPRRGFCPPAASFLCQFPVMTPWCSEQWQLLGVGLRKASTQVQPIKGS